MATDFDWGLCHFCAIELMHLGLQIEHSKIIDRAEHDAEGLPPGFSILVSAAARRAFHPKPINRISYCCIDGQIYYVDTYRRKYNHPKYRVAGPEDPDCIVTILHSLAHHHLITAAEHRELINKWRTRSHTP